MSSDPSSSPAAPSRNQKSIGLIGVGLVGNAIADRLITAGYSVHGFDFSEERLHAFVQLGGAAMETPSAVAQVASRVIVTTSEGYDVEEVLWGDRGLVSPMHRPTHIIDTATNDPDRVSRIADRVDRDKIEFIDATIAGTSDLIRKGKCVLMVGGGGAGVTACTDLFEAIGKRWFHLGGPGTASRARLALSLLVGMHRLALAATVGDRTGAVQANVMKSAQCAAVAQYDDALARDVGGEELALLRDLVAAPDELPRAREDAVALELEVDGIRVQPRRDRRRASDVRIEGKVDGHGTAGSGRFERRAVAGGEQPAALHTRANLRRMRRYGAASVARRRNR